MDPPRPIHSYSAFRIDVHRYVRLVHRDPQDGLLGWGLRGHDIVEFPNGRGFKNASAMFLKRCPLAPKVMQNGSPNRVRFWAPQNWGPPINHSLEKGKSGTHFGDLFWSQFPPPGGPSLPFPGLPRYPLDGCGQIWHRIAGAIGEITLGQ